VIPLDIDDERVRALGDGDALIWDAVLGEPDVQACADAIDALLAEGRLRPAGMGSSAARDPTLRGDRIGWDDEVAAPAVLRDTFERVRRSLNEAAWLGLDRFTVQLAAYPGDGARYVRHRDALAGDPTRRATAILYLNPGWTPAHGGLLRVHGPSGPRDVEPLPGRLVVFLSDRLEHEVLPCHALRRAATAWFRGP
jgi:SM-20-related protein